MCNTHNTTTEEVVRSALEYYTVNENGEGGVKALEIECRSREGMYKKSWRVQVDFCDKERVLSPESWPEGWGCRRYFRAQNRQPGYTPMQRKDSVNANGANSNDVSRKNSSSENIPIVQVGGGASR